MKTTKAFLAGLGTTGILICSIVLLLVLGSAVVAFDAPPGSGPREDPFERVVLKAEAREAPPGGQGNEKAQRDAGSNEALALRRRGTARSPAESGRALRRRAEERQQEEVGGREAPSPAPAPAPEPSPRGRAPEENGSSPAPGGEGGGAGDSPPPAPPQASEPGGVEQLTDTVGGVVETGTGAVGGIAGELAPGVGGALRPNRE